MYLEVLFRLGGSRIDKRSICSIPEHFNSPVGTIPDTYGIGGGGMDRAGEVEFCLKKET